MNAKVRFSSFFCVSSSVLLLWLHCIAGNITGDMGHGHTGGRCHRCLWQCEGIVSVQGQGHLMLSIQSLDTVIAIIRQALTSLLGPMSIVNIILDHKCLFLISNLNFPRIQDVESINIKTAEIRFWNLAQIDQQSISSINNQTLCWNKGQVIINSVIFGPRFYLNT